MNYDSILGRASNILSSGALSDADKFHELSVLVLTTRVRALQEQLIKDLGPLVQSGPFSGMVLRETAVEGCYIPKHLGTYEDELHPLIGALRAENRYERIINVGCADGFYAVGLSRLFPEAEVIAIDIDENAQQACGELARLNGTADRVHSRGGVTPEELAKLIRKDTLLFVDIEGAEFQLIHPHNLGVAAQNADVVVELHHNIVHKEEAAEDLIRAYGNSHSVSLVENFTTSRSFSPILEHQSELVRLLAAWEFRPAPTPWGVFLRQPLKSLTRR